MEAEPLLQRHVSFNLPYSHILHIQWKQQNKHTDLKYRVNQKKIIGKQLDKFERTV